MKLVAVISFLFLFTHVKGAIASQVNQLTLKDATLRALLSNNLINAARHRLKAAQEAVSAADSALYPRIDFEENFAASNAPTQTFMMKLDQARFTQNDFQISNLNFPNTHQNFKVLCRFNNLSTFLPYRLLVVWQKKKQKAKS